METGMQQPNNIPIELECWMIKHGIMESERSPGFTSHAKVTQPKDESAHAKAVRTGISAAWRPVYSGQEPPF